MSVVVEHHETPPEIRKRWLLHAVAGTHGMRTAVEHDYYNFHKKMNGVRLRAKYRPEQDR